MKKNKRSSRRHSSRVLLGSSPLAGENRTDPAANAQNPMADPLEMRMKTEGHQM